MESMVYQILCTEAKEYNSTRKQNVELRDEVNRLRRMMRNNGLDPDAAPCSDGHEGLANYLPDDDDYGADLLAEVACCTSGVEQSLERTSVAAPSCEILNGSPSVSETLGKERTKAK
uniref:Uncharacterized protein n=1 Tax=Nelumbo nucifera TaxID=4432 RepID=A0A822Y3G7_NELNU|nr:TPA_asm: hypothetical protein HUJ06_025631 [Nelumbo nucifera]